MSKKILVMINEKNYSVNEFDEVSDINSDIDI